MPHSVTVDTGRRPSSSAMPMPQKSPTGAFPAFSNDHFSAALERTPSYRSDLSPGQNPYDQSPAPIPDPGRWQPRKENVLTWSQETRRGSSARHTRQKSLSDAFKTIRARKGSVSDNAQEIAEALKAPVSARLVVLCVVWYLTSALTNTSSKSILNALPKPATLTVVQFAFVSTWCIGSSLAAQRWPALRDKVPALRHGIRPPSREVLTTTLPLAVFQVGGHLLSSTATARIPVSLVHTIKGLSPLFTVFAYRLVFHIHYSPATYLSLIPLTLGVMLACSAEFSGNFFGLTCAFLAAVIFVTQNIFSKKLFNEAARAEADGRHQRSRKLDKLNLLCYSSGLAFCLTAPYWLWAEGFTLMGDFFNDGALDLSEKKDAFRPGRLALEFIFNGTFHFGQNIMAFVLLSMVSPVTYSVASLIKRIFVIVVAIVWFGSKTSSIQAFGIALTFLGLYLYDRTSDAAKADRRARIRDVKPLDNLLPTTRPGTETIQESPPPLSASSGQMYGHGLNGFIPNGHAQEEGDEVSGSRPRNTSIAANGWQTATLSPVSPSYHDSPQPNGIPAR